MAMIKWILLIGILLLGGALLTGYITTTQVMDTIAPVFVVKDSPQYCRQNPDLCPKEVIPQSYAIVETPPPTPTPIPTVTVIPTIEQTYVDPFKGGERWEGMWYKWTWPNASGLQTANRGVVVYGHSYLDGFTQWNDAWGNYQTTVAPPGQRFLAVYIHEEDFGPDNNGLWGYGAKYFYLQEGMNLKSNWTGYNRAYRIIELESDRSDYYDIDRPSIFGAHRVYSGTEAARINGGYFVEDWYSLWSGKGNSWDGYILYLVDASTTDNDILITANLAGKEVYWRFGAKNSQSHIVKYPLASTEPYTKNPRSQA